MNEKLNKEDPYCYWKNVWYPFPRTDDLIEPFLRYRQEPKSSWIQLARQALLLSTNELAKRMNITRAAISKMEQNEIRGTITIDTLKRAAEALDCELIYVLKPKKNKFFSQIIWAALLQNGLLPGERFFTKASNALARMKNTKIRRKNKWTIRKHYHDARNRTKRRDLAQ